ESLPRLRASSSSKAVKHRLSVRRPASLSEVNRARSPPLSSRLPPRNSPRTWLSDGDEARRRSAAPPRGWSKSSRTSTPARSGAGGGGRRARGGGGGSGGGGGAAGGRGGGTRVRPPPGTPWPSGGPARRSRV